MEGTSVGSRIKTGPVIGISKGIAGVGPAAGRGQGEKNRVKRGVDGFCRPTVEAKTGVGAKK